MEILGHHRGQSERGFPVASDQGDIHGGRRHAPGTLSSWGRDGKRRLRSRRFVRRLRGHPPWEGRVPVCGALFFLFLSLGMVLGTRGCFAAGGNEEVTMVPPLFAAENASTSFLAPPLEYGEATQENVRSKEKNTGNEQTDAVDVKETSLGEMEIAAYFEKNGSTYSGAKPRENHTVAADLTLFSIGDFVRIGEQEYCVEDKVTPGSSDKLRIWFDSQEEAMNFGRQRMNVSRIVREEKPPEGYVFLGEFETTGYCNCALCCGIHAGGPTASGTMPESEHTVAVDPELISLGTELMIDGKKYLAEDTGRLIKGKIIDIYFNTHEEALRYGRQNKKVYIRKTEEGGGR